MTGMDRYDDKRKRAMRRQNHIARDLMSRKYSPASKRGAAERQRIKGRKFHLPDVEDTED